MKTNELHLFVFVFGPSFVFILLSLAPSQSKRVCLFSAWKQRTNDNREIKGEKKTSRRNRKMPDVMMSLRHCRAYNSSENNKICEWMKTTFVTSTHLVAVSFARNRTINGICNIFICVPRVGIFITSARAQEASSTPFTCQLYLWLLLFSLVRFAFLFISFYCRYNLYALDDFYVSSSYCVSPFRFGFVNVTLLRFLSLNFVSRLCMLWSVHLLAPINTTKMIENENTHSVYVRLYICLFIIGSERLFTF